MNQLCKVCGEPAAGFHFGAFTCEGCKSFFGRTYNNISAIAGCKNNGDCVINKKNRTACKACRLRKCLLVGMSKSGSRYGRRSNWFKIHCLLQEQHTQQSQDGSGGSSSNYEQLARLHHIQARQTYQDKTNPCIKSASLSPTLNLTATGLSQQAAAVVAATTAAAAAAAAAQQQHQQQQRLPHYLTATKFLNGIENNNRAKSESRLSATPSDSGASSAGDVGDDCKSTTSQGHGINSNEQCGQLASDSLQKDVDNSNIQPPQEQPLPNDASDSCHKQFMQIFRSHSEPLKIFSPLSSSATAKSPFAPYATFSNLPPPIMAGTPPMHFLPASRLRDVPASSVPAVVLIEDEVKRTLEVQHEPIDLSIKTRNSSPQFSGKCETPTAINDCCAELGNVDVIAKPTPLDLTLVRTQSLTG